MSEGSDNDVNAGLELSHAARKLYRPITIQSERCEGFPEIKQLLASGPSNHEARDARKEKRRGNWSYRTF